MPCSRSTSISDHGPPPGDSSLLDALGIEAGFSPGEHGPPVDADRIRRFWRGEISDMEAREVAQLIAQCRGWFERWCTIVRTERAVHSTF